MTTDGAPRVVRTRVGDSEIAVISLPSPGLTLHFPPGITAVETEVCRALATGHSNRDIARLRGTALRTVENQVSTVFRKLKVGSRAELVALLCKLPEPVAT